MNMIWNVFIEDFNNDQIAVYNVFNHTAFKEEVEACFNTSWDRNSEKSFTCFRDDFSKEVDKIAGYYFWSKAEWEILIKDLFSTHSKKVDIYSQLRLNWDAFIDYIISKMIGA